MGFISGEIKGGRQSERAHSAEIDTQHHVCPANSSRLWERPVNFLMEKDAGCGSCSTQSPNLQESFLLHKILTRCSMCKCVGLTLFIDTLQGRPTEQFN